MCDPSRVVEILKKPYARTLSQERDGTFSAQISEFPGCFSCGDTLDETYANLDEAARNWVSAALEQGLTIPEPLRFEGAARLTVQLPQKLHWRLSHLAAKEGVTLDHFLITELTALVLRVQGADES